MAPDLTTMLAKFLEQLWQGTFTFTGQSRGGDGTALLPAYSFTSEPTLGFYRSSAGIITAQGSLVIASGKNFTIDGGQYALAFGLMGYFGAVSSGRFNLQHGGAVIGSQFKVDALPTIASGFGAGAAIVAGSTPLAGAVNVGTGGAASSGVINFNGTAFPSNPFAVISTNNGSIFYNASATTTQLTIVASAAFPASSIISWVCISSK